MNEDRHRGLERLAGRLAKRVGDWLNGRSEVSDLNVLFAVLLFTEGPGGFSAYSSSAQRPDMVKALREMADRLDGEDARAELTVAASVAYAAARAMDKKIPDELDGWTVSVASFKAGLDRFEKLGEQLMALDGDAKLGKADSQDEIDESWRLLIADWTASMIQMAGSLELAVSYAPIDPRSIPLTIRGTNEIN